MRRVHLYLRTRLIAPQEAEPLLRQIKKAGLRVLPLGEVPSQPQRSPLTRRQTQVLRAMALGMRTKEIAGHLGISVKTVETHRYQLQQRTGIGHLPGLVRLALRTGVIPVTWLFE